MESIKLVDRLITMGCDGVQRWSLGVVVFWVLHLTRASVPDAGERVQVLSAVQQLALPKMPRFPTLIKETPLAVAADSQRRKLGEAHKAAKLHDSPEEELESLQNEDHAADMKALEEAAHLKATERAKTKGSTVPAEVRCYHDLANSARQQTALAERLHEEAEHAAERLKQAVYLREMAAAAAQKLKLQMDKDHKMKLDAEGQYRTEHSVALNAFEAAKGIFLQHSCHDIDFSCLWVKQAACILSTG